MLLQFCAQLLAYIVQFGQEDATRELKLNPEMFGDLVVLGDQNTAFPLEDTNGSVNAHCSHGGIEEQTVSFIISAARPYNLQLEYRQKMTKCRARNAHLWKFLLKGVELQ